MSEKTQTGLAALASFLAAFLVTYGAISGANALIVIGLPFGIAALVLAAGDFGKDKERGK